MGLFINNIKTGKPYINGIKHNAYINGQKMWNETTEEFSITVEDNGSFSIPTRGVSGDFDLYQSYNWEINWGDDTIQIVEGNGDYNTSIFHSYTDSINNHAITIKPNGKVTRGWLNAFACGGAEINVENSAKIKSINSPITKNMKSGSHCYSDMFSDCTGLTSIPENLLSNTTLTEYCYYNMFFNCTGLTSIPENLLPATTLAPECYMGMFSCCEGLTSIPENLLPATSLAEECYYGMFEQCINLISIPEKLLPATTLVPWCYSAMFFLCDSLTSIPEGLLPATILAEECYYGMFDRCRDLTSIPENLLPATVLVNRCYRSMFYRCTNLENIGNIDINWFSTRMPSQTSMFNNCTKIKTPITYDDIPTGWK